MATSSHSTDDELKCGICLELFQDPRSLPCLHTFCRECIQRTMDDHRSLKCPVCRGKIELGEEGADLLPVDQYAFQELPLKMLQEPVGVDKKCGFCGEAEFPVAWCNDCGVLICSQCLAFHKKMAYLKSHHIMESGRPKTLEKVLVASGCLRHTGVELKFLCTECSEMVCSECLLTTHKDHKYSTLEEARQSLETKLKKLVGMAATKKRKFSECLQKLCKVESEATESTEHMTSAVNKAFDVIVASVEAQRNEALQRVSQGVKEIWSQKELMEVSLAQIDSFTRFVDHTNKCSSSTSYVAMATQCIKLMEQLTCEDEVALEQKPVYIWSQHGRVHVPLDELFRLGRPSFKFTPAPGSDLSNSSYLSDHIVFTVSLDKNSLQLIYPASLGKANLVVYARSTSAASGTMSHPAVVTTQRPQEFSWLVDVDTRAGHYVPPFPRNNSWSYEDQPEFNGYYRLVVQCRLFDVTDEVNYTFRILEEEEKEEEEEDEEEEEEWEEPY